MVTIMPTGDMTRDRSGNGAEAAGPLLERYRVMRLVRGQSAGGGQGDLAALSAQELRVLSLVATGKTNKEISEALGLSDNTVKHYLGNVFEKLQVKRRSQAAAFFTQNNSTQGK